MSVIKCELQDQYVVITDNPVISAGDINTDRIEFKLDSNWQLDGVSYYCIFVAGQEEFEIPLESNSTTLSCGIPTKCTEIKGQFAFSVVAKDANNNVVKTSAIRTYIVVDGSSNIIVIDWLQFKHDLISALNDQFNLGLLFTASNDEILESILSAVPPRYINKFFIDLLNNEVGTSLEYNDSEETITSEVIEIMHYLREIEENYNYLVNGLLRITRSV